MPSRQLGQDGEKNMWTVASSPLSVRGQTCARLRATAPTLTINSTSQTASSTERPGREARLRVASCLPETQVEQGKKYGGYQTAYAGGGEGHEGEQKHIAQQGEPARARPAAACPSRASPAKAAKTPAPSHHRGMPAMALS